MTVEQILYLIDKERVKYLKKHTCPSNLILLPKFMYEDLKQQVQKCNYFKDNFPFEEATLLGMRVIPVMSQKIELFEEVEK